MNQKIKLACQFLNGGKTPFRSQVYIGRTYTLFLENWEGHIMVSRDKGVGFVYHTLEHFLLDWYF